MSNNSYKINEMVGKLRFGFKNGVLRSIKDRKKALIKIKQAILDNEQKILEALKEDLSKSNFEAYATEVAVLKQEIRLNLRHVKEWMSISHIHTSLPFFPGKAFVEPVPKGVVLIIAPWNYPFQLSLLPLIQAICAGNCVLIKPSEHAPHSALLIEKIINNNLDENMAFVVNGDANLAKELLEERFEHIFFTGSTKVAQEVMAKASKNLTPLTLELGGKNPAIIEPSMNLRIAAKRIIWGKCINAGQSCIAPDYLLINKENINEFIAYCKEYLEAFFGKIIENSSSYSRIVNDAHMGRLIKYLNDGKILLGGDFDIKHKFFSPTILTDVKEDSDIMREEIFGPILPVIFYSHIEEAVSFMNQRANPLAIYLFSKNKKVILKFRKESLSGSLVVNDTLSQAGVPNLSFGGVGLSGMGSYHGKYGFLTFSHQRSYYQRSLNIDIPIRYPPFSSKKLSLTKLIFK